LTGRRWFIVGLIGRHEILDFGWMELRVERAEMGDEGRLTPLIKTVNLRQASTKAKFHSNGYTIDHGWREAVVR
jgi:hypothetical protein